MAKVSISRIAHSAQGWVEHSGRGAPVQSGTSVQIRRFNGDIDTFNVGQGHTVASDGALLTSGRARWSCWDFSDGGPMPVKARAYRVVTTAGAIERNGVMFREWLNVRTEEMA